VRLARPVADAQPGVATVEIDRVGAEGTQRRRDVVAVEEPLEIRVAHGEKDERSVSSVAVTMRTPGDDEALALGFLFSEGVIASAADLAAVRSGDEENVVRVELAPSVDYDARLHSRHVYTTSSCGICGKASLDAVRVQVPDYTGGDDFAIGALTLGTLPSALRERQAAFEETGGVHACAAFDRSGRIVSVAEDVGRHNALDKLLGHAFARGELPLRQLGLLFSGRASFELVQKAAMAGSPLVAAIGPPSSLAVELAAEQRMTLVGFLRGEHFNVYTLPHRVQLES
jgi:FdhD protein